MDQMKTANNVSFKQRKGFFIERWLLALLIAVAAVCVLIVGLLVGYLTPCHKKIVPSELNDNDEGTPKSLPYVRLPRSIIPEHYDVELQPYITPSNFTFDGKVRIRINVLEPTDNITLHINNITVHRDSVRLTGQGSVPDIASTSEDLERQFYILHLKGQLEAEEHYDVYMEFLGSLNDRLAGFYRSSYKDATGETR
ncbi:aminopeptidase N-like [Uloborus diversus]|uniref:aminopeptidase N-like n=1 Tax=Uloborus diversus TaxID=327109 RepID=UPI00240A18EF|nr:aminopeptidase N-like [Uloborus diversus]